MYRNISKKQDIELMSLCFGQPNSSLCSSHLKEALSYNGSIDMKNNVARNLLKDRNTSSNNILNIIYNTPKANELINDRVKSVTDRANFFGTNNYYFNQNNVPTKWFGVAEKTSRIFLGADGYGGSYVFGAGNIVANPLSDKSLNNWRAEAGNALMDKGFNNFKDLYNGNYSSVKQWDIKQLKEEQNLLQPIHEKYLNKNGLIDSMGKPVTNGSILKYKDRMNYGCGEMGYKANDGCKP